MKTRHPPGGRKGRGRRDDRTVQRTRQLLVSSLICSGSLLGAEDALAAGGDTQAAATCITALPYTDTGTTVGATDNFKLPADVTSPTLTASCATIANGTGQAASLPRGAVYTGTGTGPDVVYRLSFPSGNPDTLTITMTPAAGVDLALIVYCNTCSSSLSDGLAISDSGIAGAAETVTVGNIAAGTDLYIVVDGYSTGGALPGPSGAYTLNITSNGSTQPICGAAASADLAITATDGVTTAIPGQSVGYTVTATNAGPSAVTGATVTDSFPAALTTTWTCAGAGGGTCAASGSGNIADSVNLPVGASVTYTVAASIAANATGSLSNTATVSVPAGVTDPTPGNNSATDTDTLTPQADLAVTLTDGVTAATPGSSLTYTLIATNAGPSAAPGSVVTNTMPVALVGANWTCVGSGGATCTASGSGNIADTVNLPAGGNVTYTVTAGVASGATGSLANTATVATAAGVSDVTSGNNAATDTDALGPQADLAIVVSDGLASAVAGTGVTYTIVATNSGPSAAPGAVVTNTMPAALLGASWTCVGSGGATCTTSGSGNIADTVDLPAGGSVSYTVNATVAPGATGTLANAVTVSAPAGVTDVSPANNAATDVDIIAAAPSIVQPVPALGGGSIALLLAALSALGAFFAGRRAR